MRAPDLTLEAPGTYLYTGEASSRGFCLNVFALSLRRPEARARFAADPEGYQAEFELNDDERALIAARDWTGMLRAGAHLQAILKLAAALGDSLITIGAHNTGVDPAELTRAMPRMVRGLPEGL